MDGHVAEGSAARERPNEAEERLKKTAKRPRERNYGVNKSHCCCIFAVFDSDLNLIHHHNIFLSKYFHFRPPVLKLSQ